MARSAMTPTEPSQKTEVTSQLIASGGGCRKCASFSSAAELACITGIDTATTMTARPRRNASEARRRVVPPPRGPSTAARNRGAARRSVPATPSLATEDTVPPAACGLNRQPGPQWRCVFAARLLPQPDLHEWLWLFHSGGTAIGQTITREPASAPSTGHLVKQVLAPVEGRDHEIAGDER